MDRIGVATAVDYLADSPYWMEWWGTDSRGNLEFVGHSLNPQRDNFYDYSARSWFSIPQDFGAAAVIGPYVDFGGINSYTYTVTISVPVVTARGFAGVAGADILADKFERFLTGGRDQEPVVLVNADLRVIASNTSGHLPGDLLQAEDLTGWTWLATSSPLAVAGSSSRRHRDTGPCWSRATVFLFHRFPGDALLGWPRAWGWPSFLVF